MNVSPRSLGSPSLIDAVDRALAGARLPPGCLSLEVTEASVDEEPVRAAAVLENLDRLGVRLCLDDFGTGHSSIGSLSRFPFDVVKLDRSVTHAELKAVAEGVETASQLELVRELGCDGALGFLLAAPAPADELEAWVRAGARR